MVFLIAIIACRRDDIEYKNVRTFRFESKTAENINLSEICSSIRYIPLETNSKCYINEISRIKFFGDSIFIFNQLFWNLKEILVFDTTGKFLGNFGQMGPGPEEIDNPRDIIKFNDSYLVWDKMKIAEFDNKGNFKRRLFKAFIPGTNFFADSGTINLYHGTEFPGLISQYDFEGNLLKTIKPVDPKNTSSTFYGESLNRVDNEYHLFAPSVDTVWMFSDNQILPKYIFDFAGDVTLHTLFQKFPDEIPPEMAPLLDKYSPSHVISFSESKNYIVLKYSKSKYSAFRIISKAGFRQVDVRYCNNDIDNGIFDNPVSTTDDDFIIPIEPIKILNRNIKLKSSQQPTFDKIGDNIKENDNPVLMLIRFKF